MITAVHVVRIAFMNIGGSVGPGRYPLEIGSGDPADPDVQLEGQDRTADGGPDLHGLDLGLTWAPSAAAPPSGSVTVDPFFLFDSLGHASPPSVTQIREYTNGI